MLSRIRAAAIIAAALTAGAAASPAAGAATTHTTVQATQQRAGYLYLFPFQDQRAAQAWESAYHDGGHSPWHLSAGLTALAFTQGFLGFHGIGTITSRTVHGADAHIGVGFRNPAHRLATAAVLHLRKVGSGSDAPWVVVGTDDTSLTITRPGYGGHVSRTITAGGRITGVDENLHLWVRGLSSDRPFGQLCCVAAGGIKRPWTAVVRVRPGPDKVLTVIVATGGHVAAVERFAVTGVRTG